MSDYEWERQVGGGWSVKAETENGVIYTGLVTFDPEVDIWRAVVYRDGAMIHYSEEDGRFDAYREASVAARHAR